MSQIVCLIDSEHQDLSFLRCASRHDLLGVTPHPRRPQPQPPCVSVFKERALHITVRNFLLYITGLHRSALKGHECTRSDTQYLKIKYPVLKRSCNTTWHCSVEVRWEEGG